MPPSPSPEDRVRLRLTAGSPLAEVFLVDHHFALVKRAIGDLDCTVEPGVYKVKAELGDARTEQLVVLEGDMQIDLSADLPIASPAPIEGTAWTREHDMRTADDRSIDVVVHEGEGARVFVMARASGEESRPGASSSPPHVSLHGPDGTLLVMPQPAPMDLDGLAHTVTVEVDPGPYFLRWRDDSGVTAEQCVHAVQDWQTQVFVLEDAAEPTELGRTRVSVLMGRNGFNSKEYQLRLTEEARTALAGERRVAGRFLNEALPEKFENPVLGLFGAHLMLIARDAEREAEEERASGLRRDDHPHAPVAFEQSRFDTVVDALRDLLGPAHPDVVALSTQATGAALDALEPLTAPPMLWRSWVLLIEASNDAPALIPVSTWRRTLKLLPLRPFLLWSPENEGVEVGDDWREGVARALATAKREPRRRPQGEGPLADLLFESASEASGAGGVEAGDATRRRVSRELLAPRAAIDEIVSPPTP
jgi:hypothetical protein